MRDNNTSVKLVVCAVPYGFGTVQYSVCSVRQALSLPPRPGGPTTSRVSPVFSVKYPAGVVCTMGKSQSKISKEDMEFLEHKTGLDKKSIEVGYVVQELRECSCAPQHCPKKPKYADYVGQLLMLC